MNLLGEKMTPKNDLDNLRIAMLTDGGDDAGRAEAHRESVDGALEMQFLSNRPTMRLTATWGN